MDFAGPIGLVLAFVVIFAVMILEGTSPTAVFLPGPLLLVWATTLAVGASLDRQRHSTEPDSTDLAVSYAAESHSSSLTTEAASGPGRHAAGPRASAN